MCIRDRSGPAHRQRLYRGAGRTGYRSEPAGRRHSVHHPVAPNRTTTPIGTKHVNNPPDKPQPQSTALVIDDEPQIRRLLRVTLESNGFRVFDAANGQEGIVQAAQCRPDVILLDLGLPDMDGVAVLKRLREWTRVPVIVLSVRDREDDKN